MEHFQSLVDNDNASNDEHQLKALIQLDKLRNQILSCKLYTSNHRSTNTQTSLGDNEKESQLKSIIPTKNVTNYISNLFSSLQSSSSNNHKQNELPKGVYLHGGVGCGKTFCMNLFYDSLPDSISKQKVHFHSFMLNVHKQVCTLRHC